VTHALLAALAAAAVAFVLYPVFVRRENTAPPSDRAKEKERLAEKKEQILAAIRDLDFEHAAGKLSPQDYREVREDFLAQAAAVMTEEERLRSSLPPHAPQKQPVPAEPRQPLPSEPAPPGAPALTPHCIACGQQNPVEARFCFRCGAKIETLPVDARAEAATSSQ
jgi:hypothetical protein